MQNKKVLIIIIIAIIIAIAILIILKKYKKAEEQMPVEYSKDVTVVPTMNDEIKQDTSWCGTFQLIWNDMKNEVVKKDVEFTPQLEMVKNLNKEDFNESMLSEDYYFKIYGLKTLELKRKIEKGIKEKFNQTSDIINDFDWDEKELDNPNEPRERRYFFYTMLYRKFEFLKEFDELKNGKFGHAEEETKYFGIDKNTNDSVGDQIDVLYYNSKDDFAILINTKTKDEVIFCKKPNGNTFNEIYENMNKQASSYKGNKEFSKIDEFKAPNLTLNVKKEYDELANKSFKTADPIYDKAEIQKAIQTIKFSLDKKGGEIKSEAAIDMEILATAYEPPIKKEEPRYFYVDDTFAIFFREKGKAKPYFAGRINDITKFQ